MILYIDTALTGAFHYKDRDDAESQPHLARFAALLVEEDGSEALAYCRMVEPRAAWIYEPNAIVATGISRQRALEEGQDVETVFGHFEMMRAQARLLVAFNWDHHRRVMIRTAADCKRALTLPLIRDAQAYCAMRNAAAMVGRPREAPGGGFLWPKMPEAFQAATGDPLPPRDDDPIAQGLVQVRAIHAIHAGIQDRAKVA